METFNAGKGYSWLTSRSCIFISCSSNMQTRDKSRGGDGRHLVNDGLLHVTLNWLKHRGVGDWAKSSGNKFLYLKIWNFACLNELHGEGTDRCTLKIFQSQFITLCQGKSIWLYNDCDLISFTKYKYRIEMRMVMNLMKIKVRNGIGQHCVLVNVVSSQKLQQTLQNWTFLYT